MRVLVTGASGFVGSALVAALPARCGADVLAASRAQAGQIGRPGAVAPDLTAEADWRPLLEGCEVVIHAAARVHVMRETDPDPLAAFRAANAAGTARLAEQAAVAGVRRFILLSSIKAQGESSPQGLPLRADDPLRPEDPYGLSKAEAEVRLAEIGAAAGMEWVVIRPPLVYGPGVKGNFRSMIAWLRRGIPLPLARVDNRRSLVALPNLVDFIATCVGHPDAANQRFLVSDGEDLSTPELLRQLGAALGTPPRLFPLPPALLQGLARMLGQGAAAGRLLGTLQVDIGKAQERLGWRPPVGVEEGLAQTARAWLASPS